MSVDIIVPAAGESVTEADIACWLKADGDYVDLDEPVVELETEKASLELNAEKAGILSIKINDGTVQVGDILGSIKESEKPASTPAPASDNTTASAPSTPASTPAPAVSTASHAAGHPSPAAAKLAADQNKDLTAVTGTGKDGRITKQDVAAHTQATPAASTAPAPTKAVAPAPSIQSGEREVRPEKMSRLRRTIARRLVEAQQEAAMLTTFNEVDMTEVMNIRKKYKESFKDKYDVNLGFMSFFIKATTIALQEYPDVNAQIEDDHINYFNYCDVGIAVSTPKGLVVPVIRNAEQMNFSELEQSVVFYAKKGRDGKLTPDDMQGGTFTITNGGVFGSMLSTPILNRPQSGILGMHNIVQRPMAVNGEVKIRPIMYLALTYDHRIIDGATSVRFLVKLKELLEDPSRLLIQI